MTALVPVSTAAGIDAIEHLALDGVSGHSCRAYGRHLRSYFAWRDA
jgi:hypothetical protein